MGRTVKAMVSQWLPFSFLTKKKDRRTNPSSTSSPNARGESSSSSSTLSPGKKSLALSPDQLVYDDKVLWLPAKQHLPFIMNSIEDDTDCILCCDVMLDPVTLPCGHSLCQVCLAKSYLSSPSRQSSCPVCRLDWATPPPINYCLRSVIEKLFPRKLAQRRAKSNTWGHADADILREFDRMMRTRAVLRNSTSSAGAAGAGGGIASMRFRTAVLCCMAILTTLCAIGLSTDVIIALLASSPASSSVTVDMPMSIFSDYHHYDHDNSPAVVIGSTFASMPNYLALHQKEYADQPPHSEYPGNDIKRTRNNSISFNGLVPVDDAIDYGLAERFVQRSWLPHGRIDQWTTSEVILFLTNAGLVSPATSATTAGGSAAAASDVGMILRKRMETLKMNGSMLLNLHEHQVWDANGLNITQPSTYHALMMMVYGLRNFLHTHNDPLTVFCSRSAVHCVFILTSLYTAPHLFWLYALVFHYQKYFVPLISSPAVQPCGSGSLASLIMGLIFSTSSLSSCNITEYAVSDVTAGRNSVLYTMLTFILFPRLPMLTILIEHYQGHSLTFVMWAIIFVGFWRLFKSVYSQCRRLIDLWRIGLSNTISKTVSLFIRKSGFVILITLTAWLIPAVAYPIMYIATSCQLIEIALRVVFCTEKVVRYLLENFAEQPHYRQQQQHQNQRYAAAAAAAAVVPNNNNLIMQQRENALPAAAQPVAVVSTTNDNNNNVRRRVSVMATHPHNSSSTLIIPSTDSDILTRLGVFNHSPPPLQQQHQQHPRNPNIINSRNSARHCAGQTSTRTPVRQTSRGTQVLNGNNNAGSNRSSSTGSSMSSSSYRAQLVNFVNGGGGGESRRINSCSSGTTSPTSFSAETTTALLGLGSSSESINALRCSVRHARAQFFS